MGRSSDLAKLFARAASDGQPALVEMATNAEYLARSSSLVALTPANLAATPAFVANRNGTNQTSIADNTTTVAQMNNEVYDIGGYYDTTTYKWIPPAGPVTLHGHGQWSGVWAAGKIGYASILKNGSLFRSGFPAWSIVANNHIADVWCTDIANGTDEYQFAVQQDTDSGTVTMTGLVTNSYFEGFFG